MDGNNRTVVEKRKEHLICCYRSYYLDLGTRLSLIAFDKVERHGSCNVNWLFYILIIDPHSLRSSSIRVHPLFSYDKLFLFFII